MNCCRSTYLATAEHFNSKVAEDDRRQYEADGPDKRARRLIEALTKSGVAGLSILDVGSGIGMISVELLKRGAASATLADVSPAYLEVAQSLANAQNMFDRMRFIAGDFVDTNSRVESADIVVLDRSVCCYPAWQPLLAAGASRCRRTLAMTYPRARPDVKFVLGLDNLKRRMAKDEFRAFVHPPGAMGRFLRDAGLTRSRRSGTLFWRIEVYSRSV